MNAKQIQKILGYIKYYTKKNKDTDNPERKNKDSNIKKVKLNSENGKKKKNFFIKNLINFKQRL